MDAERRRRISLLYHAARERAEEERHAFLDSACQSDDALRQEVESLLTLDTRMGALRGVPAGEPAAISDADTLQRVPEPGGTLGRYRIERLLGRGGVGTVLLAYDTTLRRRVALKVLSKGADGQTSRTRLLREARSAAALNHPNICMIHEVGEANGSAFIAMEYVEGRSLRDRLDEGALTPDDACRYGVQAADALAYAHDHSVIHRDFKAANVIVTEAGRLKVVDFGLARRGDLMMASGTFLASLVPAGSVAGTPYAMAPEQVRGEPADARTDLWALGILLYEMTVGALPFNARTIPELYSSILRDEPARMADAVPAAIRGVIERCLAKEPDRRYQHAAEVRDALEAIRAGLDGSRASAHSRPAVFSSLAFPGPFVGLTRRRAIALSGAAAIAAASGLATWRLWPRGVAGRSLAVLRFENVLNDESIDYLCEGVTESLIRQTSGLRSLRVTPRSTAFNFKGRTVDARSAGRQLAVDTVLTGTLTRQGGRLLVTAELLEVQSGARLWSNRYERDTTDLLRVQDEIARAIMDDGLRLRLTSDERRQLVRNPTSDGEAYDLYLQARYLQRSATEEGYLQARQLLRRALVRDPDFSLAYVALGATYAMMAVDGLERPTDAWPQANRYTRQALELDPDLTEAHVVAHSQAFFFDWDWAGAERERRILLQSPARDMDPQFLRAVTLERWALGRPDEALQLARKMRELDPLSHNLIMFEADYLVHDGQLDAAVSLYEKAIQTEPADPNPYFGLADIWSRQGRFDAAIAARRKAHEAASDDELKGVLSAARGEAGYRTIEKAWVRLQLDILTARAAANYLSPLDFARAYAQLDDKAEAFRYLDAAFSDRSPGLVFLKVDRAWDGIRNDPRFEAAVRRVGLP